MSDPRDFTDEMRAAEVDGLPKLYVDGVALFNERDFFECHELLEEMWRHSDGNDSKFYQGLIQAAVCLYHWGNGQFDGARRLAVTSVQKLEGLPPVYHRLELAKFLAEFRALTSPLAGPLALPKESLSKLDMTLCPKLVIQPQEQPR